jgi:hypothetical protein
MVGRLGPAFDTLTGEPIRVDDSYRERRQQEEFTQIESELDARLGERGKDETEEPVTPLPDAQPGTIDRNIVRPFKVAGYGLLKGTQGFWNFMDSAAELVSKATGLEKGGLFKQLSAMADPPAAWAPEDLAEKIVAGIFAAGPEMATIMALPGSAPITMGYMGAIRGGAAAGPEGAAKGAAEGVLLGKILGALGILRPSVRIPGLTAVGGVEAAAQGGSAEQIAESAGVMAGLGIAGPASPGRAEKPKAKTFDRTELKGKPAAYGTETDILHGQGKDLGRYAVMELADIIGSHEPGKGFAPNPKYPEKTQERQYQTDKAEQAKVLKNAQTYDPLYTVNTDPTVINGPPVVSKEGVVVGGNSRVMSLDEVYRNFPDRAKAYRDYLEANAGDYGLTPEELAGFKAPVLVRVVESEGWSTKDLQTRVRLYNQPPTQGMESKAEGISKARLLSDETMAGLSQDLQDFGTLREYLANRRSRTMIDAMVRDGALDKTQTNRMIDAKSGLLTEDGKRLAEQVIRGRIFDDPALIQEVPAGAFQKIDMALPALAKLKARGGEWDVSTVLTEALRSYGKMKARGFETPEEYLAQIDMFEKDPAAVDPKVMEMLTMLATKKPLEIKARFDEMANAAAADVPNQATFAFYTPEKPAEAFDRIFSPRPQAEAARMLRAAEKESPYDAAVKEFGEESPMVKEQLSLFNEELQRKLQAEFPTYAENVASVSGKVGLEGAGIHTLGVAINAEMVNTGRVELKGQTVKSARDVAVMAQIFRDPRYETLRLIYLKGNQVVGHEGVSSRMPGFSAAFIGDPKTAIKQIRERMTRLEADGYYLLHNHPSGEVTPSDNDAELTQRFHEEVKGFKGHVIIDSGKYAVMRSPSANARYIEMDVETKPLPDTPIGWIDPLLTPAMPHPDLGTPIKSPVDVAMVGIKAKAPDNYVTLMYRSQGVLRALQNVPAGLFNTTEHASNFLRGMARRFGAMDVVAYTSPQARTRIPVEVQNELISNGSLMDIIYSRQPAESVGSVQAEGVSSGQVPRIARYGKRLSQYRATRVAERTSEYTPITIPEEKEAEIKKAFFEGKKPEKNASLTLTGGPPGGGKSTGMDTAGIEHESPVHADADKVKKAAGMEGQAAEFHEESSRINKEIAHEALDKGYSVIYDSLMSNFSEAEKMIRKQLKRNPKSPVNVIFTNVDAETSVVRSALRNLKAESDRVIPIEQGSLKGYNRSLPTFIELFNKHKDDPRFNFILVDNNIDNRPALVVMKHGEGKTEVFEKELFDNLMSTPYHEIEGGKYERTDQGPEGKQRKSSVELERIRERIGGQDSEGNFRRISKSGRKPKPETIDRLKRELDSLTPPQTEAPTDRSEYRISPVMVSEKPADYQPTPSDLFLHHPQPELKDKAININLKRIKTGDDIRETITKTAELFEPQIQQARRGTVSREETARLADELGMSVEDLLGRRQGQAFNPQEALAARKILVTSAQELTRLANQIKAGEGSPKLLLDFTEAYHRHAAIQAQVSGMTAEAGRTLDIFNRMAEPGTSLLMRSRAGSAPTTPEPGISPRPVDVKQLKQVLDALGGEKDLTKIATTISTLDTPGKVSKFVRDSQKASKWDMFMEAWINALLSNPPTHGVNTLSNTIVAGWQVPERLLASEIGRLFKGPREIQEKEALYQAYGLVNGMKDGFRLAWQALKTGESQDPLTKIEGTKGAAITAQNLGLSGTAGRAVDLLGEFIRIPGRGLTTADEFFKAVGYRMELHARAFRKASLEGLEGEALANRIEQIIDNPELHQEVHLAAVNAMRYQTFTNELTGASAQIGLITAKAPALRLIIPFIRTPYNIIRFAGERTPLAPLSSAIRADIRAGGADRDLALSKMALGSSIMAVSAVLAAEGVITGKGPEDKAMKAALYRTGWQPYSVKIGDKYYSYGRVDPIGATIGLAADVAEIIGQADDETASDLATAAVRSVARNVTSKTYLRGLSEMFEVMSDPDRYGEKWIQRLLGTVVPAGVAGVERMVDPTLRDAHSVMDQVQSRIPGWSKDLPPRRNLWGEPIVLPPGFGPDIISPIYVSEAKQSPVDEEIIKHKVKVDMPSHQVDGVPLTPEEYSRYVELAGAEAKDPGTKRGCKETLDKLVQSREYKELSDGEDGGKAYAILKTVHAFRQLARARLMEESHELRSLVTKQMKAREEKMQPQKAAGGMPRM